MYESASNSILLDENHKSSYMFVLHIQVSVRLQFGIELIVNSVFKI